uniref:Uncharacterized protein n=1 Tax=Romanomermis culicivorax TaxID=13658 RepID=A0A915K338_ROMCU
MTFLKAGREWAGLVKFLLARISRFSPKIPRDEKTRPVAGTELVYGKRSKKVDRTATKKKVPFDAP